MAFKSGLGAVDDEIKRAASNSGGSFSPRLNYITWKNGDKKIVRFLTDGVIVGQFAEWVLSNDGKTKEFLIDPDGTDWVKHFNGHTKEYGSNRIVPATYRTLGVGIAVLREERPTGDGRTEIIDHVEQVDVDGHLLEARYFGVIKQSLGNFWQQLRGMTRRYDTICDRDYEIVRIGSDKDTKYEIAPIDPLPELRDPATVREFYGYGRPFNDADPNRFLFCPQTIDEWADYYSSEDRAKHWLSPKDGWEPPRPDGGDWSGSTMQTGSYSRPAALPVSDDDEAQAVSSGAGSFADIRAKLMPHLAGN